jgi:hypothetical protein
MHARNESPARRLRAAAALVATGLALAVPVAAEAGSIVFIKDADVWLAKDDGSGQVRLTADGTPADPYYSPSQADDGTIVVLRGPDGRPSLNPTPVGSRVYRLDRTGRRLGAPFTALVDPLPSLVPKAIAAGVSPNGRVVAVSQRLFEPGFDPGCFCTRLRAIAQNAVFKDARTGAYLGKSELVGQELWNPSWVGSDRVLLFDQFSSAGPHVYVAGVGATPAPLYRDPGRDPLIPTWNLASLGAGELTRAGDRLAVVRALPSGGPRQGPTTIQVLDASGVNAPPVPRCEIAGRAVSLEPGLNWSPDGSTLSWYESTGIWATRVDPSVPGCGAAPRLLLPGGYDHDWGSAGLPARDAAAPVAARLAVTRRGRAVASFRLSEAATVRGQVERLRGRRAAVVRRLAARSLAAGPARLNLGRLSAGRYRLRLVLTDAAGNARTVVRVFAR